MNKDCEINLTDFDFEELEDVRIQIHDKDIEHNTKQGNPFINYFKKKLSSVEVRIRKDDMQGSNKEKDNRSYCPQFLTFKKKYLAEMPAYCWRD